MSIQPFHIKSTSNLYGLGNREKKEINYPTIRYVGRPFLFVILKKLWKGAKVEVIFLMGKLKSFGFKDLPKQAFSINLNAKLNKI